MLRTTVKGTIRVSVVATHLLSGQYLLVLLRKDPQFRPALLDDTSGPKLHQNPSVFLVDCAGLPLPVCQCLSSLKLRDPYARFVVLGDQVMDADRMLKRGIHGFLLYSEVARSLLSAIRAVAGGKIWIRPGVLQDYLQRRVVTHDLAFDGLTERETEVVELLKKRMSNNEIATLLGVRNSTVKFHISNALSKLQLKSRRDLLDKQDGFAVWTKLFLRSSTHHS
jgi:DNA-binding NarL/FixJ family response regulator